MDSWICILFIQLAIIYYYHLFCCSNLFQWESFQADSVLLIHLHHSLNTLLYFLAQAHLVLSLPQPCNQPFLQGALDPFSGKLYLENKPSC